MSELSRGDIVIVITADSDDVDRRLDELEQRLGRVNDQVERQTQAYQRQNRSLATARRSQQRLLRDQTLHLRRLAALDARYGQFNSRLRDSSRELTDYNRNLTRTGDSLERIRDLSGDAPIVVRSESEVDVDSAVRAARAGESERERLHASAIRNREALERAAEVSRNRERVRTERETETEIDRIHGNALRTREALERASDVKRERERRRAAQEVARAQEREGRARPVDILTTTRNRVDAARLAETEIDTVHDTALRNRDRNERASTTRREQDRVKASLATARRLVDNFRAQETEVERVQAQTIRNREALERAAAVRRETERRRADDAAARARATIDQAAEDVDFRARNLAHDIEFRAQQEIDRVKSITQQDADALRARATEGANEIREAALESAERIRSTATEDADQVRRLARDEANEIRQRSRDITRDVAAQARGIAVGPDSSAINRFLERTIFRLQRILHSIGRLASELAVILVIMAAVTLAVEALSAVMDLASVAVIGLAGVVTFVYTNAMERAARATSLTTAELQLGQQALLRLGFLFEEASMIIEKATDAVDAARIDPTDDANVFLQGIGIDLQDIERRGQSALSIVEDIIQAVSQLPESARFERLEAIFGDSDVAAALTAAGASFRDDIERAADEIRVLNNTEIREINRLGGDVLAFFGTLYSDVRGFFVDNIDAARTIVDLAQRELRPILVGLLDYFANRVQGFAQDPEGFVDGVRRVVNTIIEVVLTLYNALKFVADAFQRLNLSPATVTSIILILIAVAGLAQVLRPLVTVLGYLHLALRNVVGPLGRLLATLGAPIGGGAAAAAGGALTAGAIVPVVVAVLAALGLGYLLVRAARQPDPQEEVRTSTRARNVLGQRAQEEALQGIEDQAAAVVAASERFEGAIQRIQESTDATTLSIRAARLRNEEAAAVEERLARDRELRRIGAENRISEAQEAALEAQNRYIESLLSATNAYIEADLAATPLGDHIRQLGITFEQVQSISERLLMPRSVDDVLAAQRAAQDLENATGRSFQRIVAFFNGFSTFARDQTEGQTNRLREFQEGAQRTEELFTNLDEALLTLRQINFIEQQTDDVGVLITQARLLVSIEERYGQSIDVVNQKLDEYLAKYHDAATEIRRTSEIQAEFAQVGLDALGSVSNALSDVILRVNTVREAFEVAFRSIGRSIIQSVINTALAGLIRRLEESAQGLSEEDIGARVREEIGPPPEQVAVTTAAIVVRAAAETAQQASQTAAATATSAAVSTNTATAAAIALQNAMTQVAIATTRAAAVAQAAAAAAQAAAAAAQAAAAQGTPPQQGAAQAAQLGSLAVTLTGSGSFDTSAGGPNLGAPKAVAPQAAGDTYNVNAYALGTASPADVERAAYAGTRRGAADNQRDPYVRANAQRVAEGR